MEFSCPTCGELNATFFPDVPCVKRSCCSVCAEFDFYQLTHCENDQKVSKSMKEMWNHIDTFHRRKVKTHIGNGAHRGAFAFTLTSSPSDALSVDDLVLAVRKIMAQKSCIVEKYAWYLEYKENQTHPHIHGMYETSTLGRIEAKHFKRAWRVWDEKVRLGAGFRGGYHRPVRSEEAYTDYIGKDGGISDKSSNL